MSTSLQNCKNDANLPITNHKPKRTVFGRFKFQTIEYHLLLYGRIIPIDYNFKVLCLVQK